MWFFFFKQKTAYDMRISDWSSDVCSSDLGSARTGESVARPSDVTSRRSACGVTRRTESCSTGDVRMRAAFARVRAMAMASLAPEVKRIWPPQPRSEEHTSELQSLMRISYAVFCLKKNRTTRKRNTR